MLGYQATDYPPAPCLFATDFTLSPTSGWHFELTKYPWKVCPNLCLSNKKFILLFGLQGNLLLPDTKDVLGSRPLKNWTLLLFCVFHGCSPRYSLSSKGFEWKPAFSSFSSQDIYRMHFCNHPVSFIASPIEFISYPFVVVFSSLSVWLSLWLSSHAISSY